MAGTVAYVAPTGALRVVETQDGVVVETADGEDAAGETRWVRAIVYPDRLSNGLLYLSGWKEIAAALGVQKEETALAWARRAVNPLPVRRNAAGRPIIAELLLRAWITDQTLPEGRYPYVVAELEARKGQ